MKICFVCGTSKELTEFYLHKGMKDGHLGKCKSCCKGYFASRYSNPETRKQIIDYESKRQATPERKKLLRETYLRCRTKNPLKYTARNRLNQAIRSGKIQRGVCEVCGKEKAHGHHTDYSKPYDVRWLCFHHHKHVHSQNTY